jgi:hypothetical protein
LTSYTLAQAPKDTHKVSESKFAYESTSQKIGQIEKPQYFINHLGCKKTDLDKEDWDTDKYIWEIGKDLQSQRYSLKDFISGIDIIFDRAYKFKDAFTEIAPPWNSAKKPINSNDLNVYKKEREEFKSILNEILLPFEEEPQINNSEAFVPKSYKKSFGLYKERIEKLNKWKEKYPEKIKGLCPEKPDNPENAFTNFHKDTTSKKLSDNQQPPLDILANRIVNTLGCDEQKTGKAPLPLWYVGGKIYNGEFTIEEWKEAFKKELDKVVERKKLSKESRIEYEIRFNNLLINFERENEIQASNKNQSLKAGTPIVKHYQQVRGDDIRLQQWIIEKKILHKEKFPCEEGIAIEGRGIIDQVHFSVDCNSADKKHTPLFKEFKNNFEDFFFASRVDFSPGGNPEALRKEREEIDKKILNATIALKGKELSNPLGVAKEHISKHSKKLSKIWEPRQSQIILQDHVDDLVSFWTKKFTFAITSPDSAEGKKIISNYLTNLNKTSHTKMLLSCLESNGRTYLFTPHGDENKGTVYIPPSLNDSKALSAIEQKNKSRGHKFNIQSNWGSAQISYDQSSLDRESGRYYRDAISKIINSSDKKTSEAQILSRITKECRLKTLLPNSSEDELNNTAKELFKKMKNSINLKEKVIEAVAVENFGFIQLFCPPLHLNFASKVFSTNKAYFGSLKPEKGRIKECASIGNIEHTSNPIISDLSEYVLGVLKANHKNVFLAEEANINPDEISRMKKTHAAIEAKEREIEKNQELFDKLKNDSAMNSFINQIKEANPTEAWKFFSFTKPLSGWMNNENANASEYLKKALEMYTLSDESSFKKAQENLFQAQQERRKKSMTQLNEWINQKRSLFNGQSAKQMDEYFYQLREHFQTLNNLYDTYEKDLSEQIKLCMQSKFNTQSISTMLPNYRHPSLDQNKNKPTFKPIRK